MRKPKVMKLTVGLNHLRGDPCLLLLNQPTCSTGVNDLGKCLVEGYREALLLEQSPQELTPDAFATVVTKLFERVHPLAIGGIEQSYALGKRISRQLLRTHMTDEERIEAYWGTVSLPFEAGEHKRIAVKIVDDRGIESLKVVEVNE